MALPKESEAIAVPMACNGSVPCEVKDNTHQSLCLSCCSAAVTEQVTKARRKDVCGLTVPEG